MLKNRPKISIDNRKYLIQLTPFLTISANPTRKNSVKIHIAIASPDVKISGIRKKLIIPKPIDINIRFEALV